MKSLFFLAVCCLPFGTYAQPLVKVKVYNSQCIPEEPSYPFVQVTLYRMPDSVCVFTGWEDYLTGEQKDEALLPPGKYKAVYYNQLRQQLTKDILLGERDTAIGFCVDSLISYPQNTLAQFRNGDSLVMDLKIAGCFQFDQQRIIIWRSNDAFHATLHILEQFEESDEKQSDKRILGKPAHLNEKQLAAFVRFENGLNLIRNSYDCTTSVTTDIECPYWQFHLEDATCSWNGYRALNEILFGKDR